MQTGFSTTKNTVNAVKVWSDRSVCKLAPEFRVKCLYIMRVAAVNVKRSETVSRVQDVQLGSKEVEMQPGLSV